MLFCFVSSLWFKAASPEMFWEHQYFFQHHPLSLPLASVCWPPLQTPLGAWWISFQATLHSEGLAIARLPVLSQPGPQCLLMPLWSPDKSSACLVRVNLNFFWRELKQYTHSTPPSQSGTTHPIFDCWEVAKLSSPVVNIQCNLSISS